MSMSKFTNKAIYKALYQLRLFGHHSGSCLLTAPIGKCICGWKNALKISDPIIKAMRGKQ